MFPQPGMRVGAHVEVFKTDEETGRKILVQTSRPCVECGNPLDGLVVPYKTANGDQQVHAHCREKARIHYVKKETT